MWFYFVSDQFVFHANNVGEDCGRTADAIL